ncbi:MAG: class I SAM-dependent methyltransferase [Alphaproteobacteria bacterium]|nr:class I SAM-dependent methyltransferase [Alphaproteobacteria bacterium]
MMSSKKICIDFLETQMKLESIEGWFFNISHGIFDSLLQFQTENTTIQGHLGEIGVFKGKSASIIAKHTKSHEDLFLIDPTISINEAIIRKNISNICKDKPPNNISVFPTTSECFKTQDNINKYLRNTRFFHIDGCHTGEAVDNDLDIAHDLLSNEGIVVLDDYFNIIYPQITEALYNYLYRYPYRFKIFLCGNNKAYLCRPKEFSLYYNYCMTTLQQDMLRRKITLNIMKTSGIADSHTISARGHLDINIPSIMLGPDYEANVLENIVKQQC